MSESLRALVAQATNLSTALIESGGELPPEMEAALTEIDVKLPIKIDGYAVIMERLEMESEYWKQKAELYVDISRGCLKARERLKESLKFAMGQLGADELKGIDVRFKLSNAKPKLVINEALLETGYLIAQTVSVPDKKRIEQDLKDGIAIEGAMFMESKSLRSYANKGAKNE